MSDELIQTQTQTVSSGLRTAFRVHLDQVALHVVWIAWDSGFRGTGLAVGDEIVAVDGVPTPPNPENAERHRSIGQEQESAQWKARRLGDAASLRLTVRRKVIPGEGWETREINGLLRAERVFQNTAGQRTLGQGGPPRLARDGFSDAWASWYEKRVFDWERQLDGGVWQAAGSSRMELQRHLEAEPRVRYLLTNYPGPFAQAVQADWEHLRVRLSGRQYHIEPSEYAYREVEAKLVGQMNAAADTAWDAFVQAHAAHVIAAPGPLNHVAGDETRYAGKLLQLPPVTASNWVTDVGRAFVSWRANGGWVFTPLESPESNRMWQAQQRYRKHVTPVISDEFALIGRILPQSRLISPKGRAAVSGLEVEPMAALVGRDAARIFVDMQTHHNGVSQFAGENLVQVIPSGVPPDDASPRQVLQALIAALYARDEQTWFALFADWHFSQSDGNVYYYPFYPYAEARRDSDWIRSRKVVLEQTVAIRITWLDTPRILAQSGEFDGVPRIERVAAELDHVGVFEGEHRAFASIDVHRHWLIERRDDGPWRIITHQGI